ncbi:16S rRNA (guanine(527)-N(7))-methyltransferase RsmG [Robiginitalea sp. SC105]|uniref:16S rRNA (guanine(527)-N(7))-methyltransferase RsmG n=1 Tax=Robiginitalea sp. SC105 TaxID=2762332 RepID=UPI00163A6A2E|nr:16S rRNA (guanine(527)-N(7))-methyltransferase RsmG [Robiginitalea sp. SC105]MBC2839026.1 16S rRNA (guanine(527)-N(7))-methyltransferase RsmG [Robiginitalea sp. SC105]
MTAETVFQNFPNLSARQQEQFLKIGGLYQDWNQKINVVSRKDIDELYLRHVLHSLGIAKVHQFLPGTRVLDVGTGGGFPGIPLAILFPESRFTLVDAIGKKIKVVQDVIEGLGLENARAQQIRAEQLDGQFDFIVSRAVAAMPTFVHWTAGRLRPGRAGKSPVGHGALGNGILYLKGGDLSEELGPFPQARVFDLSDYFEDPFFLTKKVVYLPAEACR